MRHCRQDEHEEEVRARTSRESVDIHPEAVSNISGEEEGSEETT